MFKHEKALFEVASLQSKKYVYLRCTYIIPSFLIALTTISFQSFLVYTFFSVVLLLFLVVLSERYIKKRKLEHEIVVKNQFLKIFYPSMLMQLRSQDDVFVVNENHLHLKTLIDDLYDSLNTTIHSSFSNGDDLICMTEHHISSKKKMFRVFLSFHYAFDGEVELRCFSRPKKRYVYKEVLSGFQVFAMKKEHVLTFKKLYEKLRVIQDIDQLDVKITPGNVFMTYKITSLKMPKTFQSKESSLKSHFTFLSQHLKTYKAISNTLKENNHAHRK